MIHDFEKDGPPYKKKKKRKKEKEWQSCEIKLQKKLGSQHTMEKELKSEFWAWMKLYMKNERMSCSHHISWRL